MPHNSDARYALQSMLPEDYLISKRAVHALAYKYQGQMSGEDQRNLWFELAVPTAWIPEPTAPSRWKRRHQYFDGMHIDSNDRSPVSATELSSGEHIAYGSRNAILMHVSHIRGANHFRSQLGAVATYIENDPALRQKRYVAGITYKEMGALALRLGLRDMEITKTNPDYEICVRASHKAYCAINNKPRSFNLSAVFLPTDEFIFNFRSHGGQ